MANGEELSALTVTPDGATTTVLDFPYEEEESTPDGEPSEEDATDEEDFDEEADEAETEDEAEAETEAEAPADEGEFETYGGEDESADEGSAYVDNGDDAEPAETEETGESEETNGTESLGESGWVFSFYGVPVNANGQKVEYTIVQDEVEKYDYTIEYASGYVITNYPLAETVLVTFDANGGEGEMEGAEIAPQSEYTLPESGFTAPEGIPTPTRREKRSMGPKKRPRRSA